MQRITIATETNAACGRGLDDTHTHTHTHTHALRDAERHNTFAVLFIVAQKL